MATMSGFMNKSFLQTKDWLEFQESIGHKTWRFDNGKIKANIIQHKMSFGKNYLYIPHGPEIFFNDISSGLKNEVGNFLKYLKDLAKDNKSVFVKIEPLSDVVAETIFRKGIKRSKKQLQPYKTVIVNLGLSEDELLSRMHHKTRYNIKVADKHNIRVEPSSDIDIFWKLLQKTSKRDRFSAHSKDHYRKLIDYFGGNGEIKTHLVLAYHESKPIAGALVLQYGDTGYYLHGASDHEYRSMMAPYALHWNAITYFKERGLHYYDFWGIDAQKWPGVTRFKLGWGGDVKEYPGSFDMPISKFWYLVYKIARRVF